MVSDLQRRRLRERLRERRLERGMTQAELAAAAGMNAATVSHIENGKTEAQPRSVKRLAVALGCRPSDLFAKGEDEAGLARFVAPTLTMRPVDVRPLGCGREAAR